ncbi:unnamed protein product [Rotaria sp. Silwood2]|nr:unnamed protein product [Rotaria sp. Silwood2]
MFKLGWSIVIAIILLVITINLALLPLYLRKVSHVNECNEFSLEIFTISGIDMKQFNPMFINLIIRPNNVSFNTFLIFHNDEMISYKNYVYNKNKNSYHIQMKFTKDGLQHLEMIGIDSNNNTLYEDFQFWTGSNKFKVRVINEYKQLVKQIPVGLQLIEDDTIQIIDITDKNGEVLFENIPSRNVRIESSSNDNMYAIKAVIGPSIQNELQLKGFNRVSLIDNENLQGWIFSNNTYVSLIPAEVKPVEQLINYINVNISTRRGEQTISRTFETKPNTKSVKIRYRFIINGVLNQSIYLLVNDYFHLTLRSKKSLTRRSLLLSLDMFVTMSEWMELSIPVTIQPDIIQIDITIKTIINRLFNLNFQIDSIEEISLAIMTFELKKTLENSTKFENLRFLSIHATNSNQSSSIKIHGSLVIHGNSYLSLKNIILEIIQQSKKVATGNLTSVASEKLLNKSFGSTGILNVTNILLFELNNDQITTLIKIKKDGSVIFRVRIISNNNEEITADNLIPIKLLIYFIENQNQNGNNNWILPSIQKFINYLKESSKIKNVTNRLHDISQKSDDGYFSDSAKSKMAVWH